MNRAAKVGIVMGLMFGILIGYMYQYNKLALEVDSLKGYISKLEQSQQVEATNNTTEGKYTLITNLSSSIYLNSIPAGLNNLDKWEDVNGVQFFDVTKDGTLYRYVEGHIEWPQLALYAPNMCLEVVSDSEWPKETK
jgi:hypothetical protein